MDPIQAIFVWIGGNWFALAVGAGLACGMVHIKNPFAKDK